MRGLGGVELTDEVARFLLVGCTENKQLATDVRQNEALSFLIEKWAKKLRLRSIMLAYEKADILKKVAALDAEIDGIKARTKVSGT